MFFPKSRFSVWNSLAIRAKSVARWRVNSSFVRCCFFVAGKSAVETINESICSVNHHSRHRVRFVAFLISWRKDTELILRSLLSREIVRVEKPTFLRPVFLFSLTKASRRHDFERNIESSQSWFLHCTLLSLSIAILNSSSMYTFLLHGLWRPLRKFLASQLKPSL